MAFSFWEVKLREAVLSADDDRTKLLPRTDTEADFQTSRHIVIGIVQILWVNLSLIFLLVRGTSADSWKALEETVVGMRHYCSCFCFACVVIN